MNGIYITQALIFAFGAIFIYYVHVFAYKTFLLSNFYSLIRQAGKRNQNFPLRAFFVAFPAARRPRADYWYFFPYSVSWTSTQAEFYYLFWRRTLARFSTRRREKKISCFGANRRTRRENRETHIGTRERKMCAVCCCDGKGVGNESIPPWICPEFSILSFPFCFEGNVWARFSCAAESGWKNLLRMIAMLFFYLITL